MAFLPAIAAVAAIGGGVMNAMGQMQAAKAQANAARYNADVAAQNAQVQQRNATMAIQAGEQRVAMEGLKTKAQVGGILANQAAAGLDTQSGSAIDVRSSAAELGELNALTVRSNAVKEAYGYQVQSVNDTAQSKLDLQQAKAAETAGTIGAVGTLLGTAGSAASNWSKWQALGGGNTIPASDTFSYGTNSDYGATTNFEEFAV